MSNRSAPEDKQERLEPCEDEIAWDWLRRDATTVGITYSISRL